jgi:peptidyl-prolyl cis-trans isomerase D
MFEFIQRHKRGIQIVFLILIVPPFALFGIDSYFRQGEEGREVARVGDYSISQQEFSRALQDRQRALQRMAQGRVDPAMIDNPELRHATLEGLIQRRLLLDGALRAGMTVTDQQLHKVISELPIFHDETGKFSNARYEQFLKSEGQTPVTFEARLRQDLILQQLTYGDAESTFVPRTVAERLVKLAEQKREVSQLTITPDRFAAQVKLEPDAAIKYYEANRSEFEIPERVRLEYIVLSLESQMQQVKVDPAEVEKYYAANRAQFEKRESQARHILIAVEPGAGPEAKQKARARADDIHRQLTQKPAAFPELAKQFSQDPGSAAKGGDLGFVTRGSMKDVPEFEAALFTLKESEISPPVETKLGFHIIQATEVRGARGKTLEEMRGQIEAELKKQVAARMFAELAEKFNNVVYEQSDSLKPAAELVKTAPRQSGWVTRTRAEEPLLSNPKVLQAVFSEDVLKNKRNTEIIEAGPSTLVAARVIEHKPAEIQPFEAVQSTIEKKLVMREATRLAAEEGKATLELLKSGKDANTAWSAPQLISRSEHKGLPETVVRQAFRVDASKLPVYAGVENPQGGYVVVKVTRLLDAQEIAPEQRQAFTESLRRILGQEELTAYVADLKQKAGVKINKEHLERK